MSSGNGDGRIPTEVFEFPLRPPGPAPEHLPALRAAGRRRSLVIAAVLFGLTLLSTLAAGAQFAADYAGNRATSLEDFFRAYVVIFTEPRALLAGLPFSFTLIGILLAHELGHYFACRYYSISASYPYFIPAPTLIGTLGAFIRIRSPIVNRKALFDVGIAGPVVGFLFAVPALALAVAYSKVVPAAQANAALVFGDPLISRLLMAWLRPGVAPSDLLLHPVGRAAWVGLFATALNLLPAGQLDGGHILYSLASEKHRRVSLAVALLLVPLGLRFWWGWLFWGTLLLLVGFRHPPLLNRWEPLDGKRQVWAAVALLMFALCFMPAPFTFHD
jgi:membrane-associated protease RseP (regulator of RpoE activity)